MAAISSKIPCLNTFHTTLLSKHLSRLFKWENNQWVPLVVGVHSVGALSCKITRLIDYKSNFGVIEIHQENNNIS